MNKDLLIGAGVGSVIGTVATAVVLTLVYRKKFELELEAEIQNVRLDYARHYVDHSKPGLDEIQVFEEPTQAVDKIEAAKNLAKIARASRDEIIHEMNYSTPEQQGDFDANDPVVVLQTKVEINVFDEPEPDIVVRDPDHPYLISIDEFMEDEQTYDKITLTYFEDDDTLIEEKDEQLVPDVDNTVGEDNLTKFGLNPKDRDTIHVRNERLECDFEITRDTRAYTEVILGVRVDPEDKPGPRKFKGDD